MTLNEFFSMAEGMPELVSIARFIRNKEINYDRKDLQVQHVAQIMENTRQESVKLRTGSSLAFVGT